jgi:hypothetical protein
MSVSYSETKPLLKTVSDPQTQAIERGSPPSSRDVDGYQMEPGRPGLVMAPSLAEDTLLAYLAKTPVV